MSHYRFKTANTLSELQAIYRLNYRTFVEEIPQHGSNAEQALIDQFDQENTYLIALQDQTLVGMVAVRGNRPFSLDSKLENLESFLPGHQNLCEIRLLSVEPEHRNGRVFWGLMNVLSKHAAEQCYDLAVISGTVRQVKLYRNLGFVPFGPLVGTEGARYQPMYLSRAAFEDRLSQMSEVRKEHTNFRLPLNFLPGPVSIKPNVRQVFAAPPISHRSRDFKSLVQKIKKRLHQLTGAEHAEILLGSGTLANDAIAWQLKQLNQKGLILTCGEFGDRLVDHAVRAGLDFRVVKMETESIEQKSFFSETLARYPETGWLWTVHCETSTGAMTDLAALGSICVARGVKLCVDAISTFGLMPVDLREVYFASAVSGKAVGGYPGLAIVFYSHEIKPGPFGIPRYLDLNAYVEHDGVPYTHSSNLVEALDEALTSYPAAVDFDHLKSRASWLRAQLAKMGCEVVAQPESTSPAVITIALPAGINSEKFGDQLAENGCLLSYQSRYLLAQNRVQICMMSDINKRSLHHLLSHMRSCLRVLH
jgi:aspartate aminotransferase-like enzyme/ribosomal protein S18 acetylase RimI-like enzyme